MLVSVIGAGYVGLSNAVLLARQHEVILHDLDEGKLDLIESRKSPIKDEDISKYLAEQPLSLSVDRDGTHAYRSADVVIVATPTNYDVNSKYFDTSSVESAIELALAQSDKSIVLIKSTIPVGFVQRMRARHSTSRILFSPEFLREGRALHDNLYPSRIVVGDEGGSGAMIASLFSDASIAEHVPVHLVGAMEAEAIKLFSNTYLALRVAYFNELDSYAMEHEMNAAQIISGVSGDQRIGDFYNNPSFGYGGYCLPKDTRQLLSNYEGVPQELISAVVNSNATRINFIVNKIAQSAPKVVGVFRLAMKQGSDNWRDSSSIAILDGLVEKGFDVIVYEPGLDSESFRGAVTERDLSLFKSRSDIVVANRIEEDLRDVTSKLFCRDAFGRDS
ncbi:nucleotide sugar dehydrogenase [Frateuria aurantia]